MAEEERRRREGIDSMIMEMVTGPREQIAPCIRNALERGWEQPLPKSLMEFQQRRNEEIERVCSRYYAEFLGSVQELLTAKSRSISLKHQIVRFNEDIKLTGQETLKTGSELQRQKSTRKNINAAIVVLSQCRELTSLVGSAKLQIQDGQYYHALRTLDSISHQLSNAYDQPFIRRVNFWLPELCNQIKAAALKDVSQWLVVIRSKTVSIGRGALRKCVNYMTGQGSSAGMVEEGTSSPTPAKLLLQQVHDILNYSSWMEEEELVKAIPAYLQAADAATTDKQMFDSVPESLDALHRALYIHAHLGALEELRTFYVNNRLPQATLPTTTSNTTTTGTTTSTTATASSNSNSWLSQIQEALAYSTGFFVTEHFALKATEYPQGLLSLSQLEEVWWGIQREVCDLLESQALQHCHSPADFVQLKQTLLLVAYTLGEDCFRFDTQPLIDEVRNLKDKYQTMQLQSLEAECREIFSQEAFQPLSVASESQYQRLVVPYGLDRSHDGTNQSSEPSSFLLLEEEGDLFYQHLQTTSPASNRNKKAGGGASSGLSVVRYPRTFAFSAIVPKLSLQCYRMVLYCFLYSLQLQLPAAMEAVFLKLTEEGFGIIDQLINKELSLASQAEANFPISKACQISVDANSLAKMILHFEKLLQQSIARLYSNEAAAKTSVILQNAKRNLENTSINAQQLVFELIQRKIDELLEGMSFIEWEASSLQTSARSYAEDVVSYLQVTFMCLSYLPKMAREGIHFASCSHINNVMLDALLDPRKVKSVNTNGLYNFQMDVRALENFADSCGILQLRECFAELKQTVGALLHRDINTIMLDASLREGVFPKIQTAKLIIILEKYKPLALFSQVKNQQRSDGLTDLPYLDKKKVAEYIKELKRQLT